MRFSNKPSQQIKANLVWFTRGPSLRESVVADLTCVLLEVISNQESRRLQYALKQRALELGWHEED